MNLAPWYIMQWIDSFYVKHLGEEKLLPSEFEAIRMAGQLRPWKTVS